MNNPSPLLPQGSLLEQKNKGRARVKIAVFVVLAIHGIGLLALLMQGCKKEPEQTPVADQTTNANPVEAVAPPVPPVDTNPPPAMTPTNPAPVAVDNSTPAAPQPTEYKVVQGDTFSTIAKKFHVSLNALMAANPGAEPTKLQIGQALHIPAPAAVATASNTGTMVAPGTDTAGNDYTVKSGDTLTSIASHYHVTVKALRSANSLTTDRIRVGQKLKIPVKVDPSATAANSNNTSATPSSR